LDSSIAFLSRWAVEKLQLKAWRKQATHYLTSQAGKKLRSLRGVEVENV